MSPFDSGPGGIRTRGSRLKRPIAGGGSRQLPTNISAISNLRFAGGCP